MDRLNNIKKTSELIKEAVSSILMTKGYSLRDSQYHEESFGSRFYIWINNAKKHCYRLIWDGRDSWFILEESPYVGNPDKVAWADVVIVPFDSNVDSPNYRLEITNEIIDEIR
jgi:hypothetical protein